MLEIRHFRLIDAIHRAGSLSGAARLLGFSQPAVSQQLRQLERLAGTPVLTRVGRKSHLTEAGEVLLRHAHQVLEATERAQNEVDLIAGLHGGVLRLTVFPSAAATIIPIALAMLRQRHPDLTIRLMESDAKEALEALGSGQADVAVVGHFGVPGSPPPDDGRWLFRTILEEHVMVALHADHDQGASKVVALRDLQSERWIAGCDECRSNLGAAAASAGFIPDVALETDDYVAVQRLAGLGLGVALIPELMVAAARVDPTLQFRPIDPPRIRRVSTVVTPSTLRVPGVLELCGALKDAAQAAIHP